MMKDPDSMEYEDVVNFIETCSDTMLPALLATTIRAAKKAECFNNDLAMIRYVTTVIEKVLKENSDDT